MYTDPGGPHQKGAGARRLRDKSSNQDPESVFDGYTPEEAISLFGKELTEFEKIEIKMGSFEKIYTIGRVRR